MEPRCVCGHVHGCIFGKVAGKQGTANLQDEALVCVSPKSTAVDLVQVDFHSCKIKRRGRFLFSFYAVCIGIQYHVDQVQPYHSGRRSRDVRIDLVRAALERLHARLDNHVNWVRLRQLSALRPLDPVSPPFLLFVAKLRGRCLVSHNARGPT